MGFCIYINCPLDVCKDTGRYYYYKGFEKIYDMPPVVPEEHREFIRMKGNIFRIYANYVTDENSTSIENFVDKFPEWSDIVEGYDYEEYNEFWNEDKHERFYAALKWFSEKNSSCNIYWTS